jgi:HlyD family secretion protein
VKSPLLQGKNRRMLGIIFGAGVFLVVLYFVLGQRYETAEGSVKKSEVFTVREGPLTISVTTKGTIKAKDQIILKNEVEVQAHNIFLIEEGTVVKEGDLLVELDASQLVDGRVDQQIMVQNSEATFISDRENLEVVKNQAESDVSAAKLAAQFAQEDLTKYVEGDYPMLIKEAEAKIALALSEESRTKEQLQGSQRLLDEGFLTSIEFDEDKALAERAQLDLELAQSSLNLLKEYTYTRKMTELQSAIEEADRALRRAELKAGADVIQAEAKLRAGESEFQRQQDKLTKLDEQIKKAKIYAPAGGLVIHATTAEGGGWRSRSEPLDEGQTVRERQELIYLPTANEMTAEVRVHESNLNKIKAGMGVRITIEALVGKVLTGHITRIAPLPDAQSSFMNPDLKEYVTQIEIEGATPDLRTGMTCEAEIMVARFDKATYVPVQSVFMVKGKPTAFISKGEGGYEERPVELGLDNNSMLQIASGLKPGETVLMTPPLEIAAVALETTTEESGEESKFIGAREVATPPAGAPTEGEGPGGRGEGSGGRGEGRRDRGGEGGAPEGATAIQPPTPAADGAAAPGGAAAGEGPGGGERAGRGEGGGEGGGGWGGDMSDEERAKMRERFQNMTPEEREKMREERMKNMTPEEREAWEKRRQERGNRDGQSQ